MYSRLMMHNPCFIQIIPDETAKKKRGNVDAGIIAPSSVKLHKESKQNSAPIYQIVTQKLSILA
jgi:hypothetical protein